MREIKIFSTSSGGVCKLDVLSSPFSASIDFLFDYLCFQKFILDLQNIEKNLVGEAKLFQEYEEPYICFKGNALGHVIVSGVLGIYSEHTQILEFSFKTDQTALSQFIAGLNMILE